MSYFDNEQKKAVHQNKVDNAIAHMKRQGLTRGEVSVDGKTYTFGNETSAAPTKRLVDMSEREIDALSADELRTLDRQREVEANIAAKEFINATQPALATYSDAEIEKMSASEYAVKVVVPTHNAKVNSQDKAKQVAEVRSFTIPYARFRVAIARDANLKDFNDSRNMEHPRFWTEEEFKALTFAEREELDTWVHATLTKHGKGHFLLVPEKA